MSDSSLDRCGPGSPGGDGRRGDAPSNGQPATLTAPRPLTDGVGASPGAREHVLDAARAFFAAKAVPEFVPGQSYVPVTGKILDESDLLNLVDSSLDMWLTAGRFADEFEPALAARFGTKHARATVSGSAANLLAFACLTSPMLDKIDREPIRPGDEVLTVAAGFPTTVAPIVQHGCVPVFVDVELETHNVNVELLRAAVSSKTRAVMMAHTLGNPFNLDAVTALCREHNLFLVEDCCDAFGATFNAQPIGTFGDVATLSFYPAHHITTGEGGAVMTNSGLLRRVIESFRDWGRDCWCPPGKDNTCGKRFDWQLGELPHGYDHKYIYSHLGYNLKMTDMQAAIGLSQLAKLDAFIAARRSNFDELARGLRAIGMEEHFHLPRATLGSQPSWFGFPLTIRDGSKLQRRDVVQRLEAHRIGTRLMFAGNLIRQPAFKGVPHRIAGPLTNTDKTMNDTFWIGVWPGIDRARRDYMIDTFGRVVRELLA